MYNYFIALGVSFFVVIGTVFICSGAVDFTQDPAAEGTSELLEMVGSKDKKVRIEALIGLGKSSGDYEKVTPVVVGRLGELDPLESSAASQAIVDLGANAVPHLKPFLESEDFKTYALGCEACRVIGKPCSVYVPLLLKRLRTGDDRFRGPAIGAMAGFGKAALPAMDEITAALGDKKFMTQVYACKVLASMGRDAKPAGPQLVVLAETGNPSARSWATIALGAIGPVEEYDVVEILDGKLDDFLLLDKQRALQGLALIGPPARAALPNIKRLMADKSKSCPHDAAYAYWKVTGDSEGASVALVDLLEDVDYVADTIEILGDMGPAAKESVPKLVVLLSSTEDHLREGAALALGAIGPDAKSALPALERAKSDPDLLIRSAAQRAIQEIQATEAGG